MAEEIKRPKVITDYIEFDKMEKLGKTGKEKLRAKVLPLLKLQEFPGVTYRENTKDTIMEPAFLAWAREKLKAKDVERLFVKTFDPNMIGVLVMEGLFKMSDVPEGCITTKVTPVITVTEKD